MTDSQNNLDEQLAQAKAIADYGDDKIQHLEWTEHIRRRPGMYIGKQGDGSHADDGIYILLKEVIDNSIDEYAMGFGKMIEVKVSDEGHSTPHLSDSLACHVESTASLELVSV